MAQVVRSPSIQSVQEEGDEKSSTSAISGLGTLLPCSVSVTFLQIDAGLATLLGTRDTERESKQWKRKEAFPDGVCPREEATDSTARTAPGDSDHSRGSTVRSQPHNQGFCLQQLK